MSYPEVLTLGLRLERLGDKSVTWEIGVFAEGNELSSATGRFTHAFVDTHTGRSATIPVAIRSALEVTFA